jgi:small subunit ribosomal protein S19
MSRSSKKGPAVDPKLMKRVLHQKDSGLRDPIKTWSRRCTIVPEFVGHTFMVHNGNKFLKVFVSEEMVGHKLGEFSPTRTFRGHPGGREKAAATSGGTAASAPAAKA